MMRRAAVLTLVGIMLAAAPAAERFDAEASGNCTTIETSGTGVAFFATCVTDTGNVRKFETVSGIDHFAAPNSGDSYTICDNESGHTGSRAWSRWGVEEFNFSYPTTHAPHANVRKTADGRYTLTQTFVRDATQKQLTVRMTLRNNGPGPVTGVHLQRAADINASGTTSSDVFLKSNDSIAAIDAGTERGMLMSGLVSPDVSYYATVRPYGVFDANDVDRCNPSPDAAVSNP